jgi:hypothetical protein
MGLILLVFVFPACVWTLFRRRRRGGSITVPLVLAVYCLGSAAWTMLAIIHLLAGAAGVDDSMKATLLAKGISEFMNDTGFWLFVDLPLLVGALFLDRRLQATAVST